MGKNWITTVGGLLTAIGASLILQEDPTLKLIGQICSIIGPLVLGWAAKQYNVTGGSVPQPTPPGVALKSDALGMVAAVDAIQKKEGVITIAESSARIEAQAVVDTPVSLAIVGILKRGGETLEGRK
jgi:hypothetical protein